MGLNNQPASPNNVDPAKRRLASVRGLSEFIGQTDCVRRLRAFGDLYKAKSGTPEHILLTGPDGIGKSRLAQSFAKTYSVGLREVAAESLRRIGDLTAEITSMDLDETLIIRNIHALRQPISEVLQMALQESRILLRIGMGPGARVHPYELKRFTCVATAPKPSDVSSELVRCFSLSLQLQPYVSSELELIANTLATENGLILADGVARLLANVARGDPNTIEQLVKRFSRLGKVTVTAEDATQVLAAFGLNPRAISPTEALANADDLNALTGIEFEKLVMKLLQRMGFQAEMTRATGDGGIDIVAQLASPFTGGRYLIQCKRFADTLVGAPVVREFYGAFVADRKAIKGIFITTSDFTDQAREFAQNLPLELIDGSRLKLLLGDVVSGEARTSTDSLL